MASRVISNVIDATESLPVFDSSGHLPPGIHTGSLGCLARLALFNEHRRKMWLQLSSFLIDPVVTQKFGAAYVGGGFISSKPQPSDVDLILETAIPYGPAAYESLAPFFVMGLDKIHLLYGVHLQFWMPGAPPGLTDYRTFFQYDRPDHFAHTLHRARGIVRINLADPTTLCRLRRYTRGENTTGVPTYTGPVTHPTAEEIAGLHGIKRQLALMSGNASRLVVVTDAKGRVEWVNHAFVRACGYTLEEVRGHRPGELLQGPNSSRESIQLMRQAISELRSCDCRIVNYRKDGTPYTMRIRLSPLFERGDHVGFFAVEEDLSKPETARADPLTAQQAA